jgi:cysteine desulfurase
MRKMRDKLYNGFRGKLRDIKLNGHPEKCLPNTLSSSFPGIDANILLSEVKEHLAASAGAVTPNFPAGLESTVLSGSSVNRGK